MNKIELEYDKFKAQVMILNRSFIDRLSDDTLKPTEQDEYLVKAFIVLFHAALEDYFEKITTKLLELYFEKYKKGVFVSDGDRMDLNALNRKIKSQMETYIMIVNYATFKASKGKITKDIEDTYNLLTTKSNYEHGKMIEQALMDKIKTVGQYVENILKESKDILNIAFEQKNQGASLPNLSEMLTAVGIDINKDLNLQNALRQLVYHRGDYAHLSQNSKITRLLDKAALENCVNDCLKLCENIKTLAINKI